MTGRDYKNEEIKALREQSGLTQEQLANKLNIHWVTVSRVENGRNCSVDLLRRIATALDVDIRDLMRSQSESPDNIFPKNITLAVDAI